MHIFENWYGWLQEIGPVGKRITFHSEIIDIPDIFVNEFLERDGICKAENIYE